MSVKSIEEISDMLNADPQELHDLANRGQLAARRLGDDWYFSDRNLEEYQEALDSYRQAHDQDVVADE